jgi:hypothetical protein
LKTAGAGAAAAGMAGMAGRDLLGQMFPRGVQAAKKPPPEPKIPIDSAIIIGAGVGGLTAASLLVDQGNTVTVIESCHRPGGRLQTCYFPNGQHAVAAGMEWYTCDYDFEWLVKDYLGFPSKDIYTHPDDTFFWWKDTYCYCSGGWGTGCVTDCLPLYDPEKYWDYETDSKKFYDCIVTVEPLDLPEVCWLGSKKEPWDVTDYNDYMTTKYDASMADHWGNVCFPSELGVAPNLASESLGHYCMAYWYWDNAYCLKQGNYAIVEALMSRIPAGSVKLNEVVSSVTSTATGVQVESNKGTYTADIAIVSVPHNVVAGIVPELPSDRAAINEMMMNPKALVALLQFSERFWLDLGMKGWGGYIDYPEGGSCCVSDETSMQTGTEGILSIYINEPQSIPLWPTDLTSIHVRGSDKDAVVDHCLAKLDEIWPASQYYNGQAKVFAWQPYVPVYPPRFVRDGHYTKLRQPIPDLDIGPIWFAADYPYGPGLTSAVHLAMDVADKFE